MDVINGQEEADVYGQQCNEVCVRAICGPIPIVGRTHCLKITKICTISHLNFFSLETFSALKVSPLHNFQNIQKSPHLLAFFNFKTQISLL